MMRKGCRNILKTTLGCMLAAGLLGACAPEQAVHLTPEPAPVVSASRAAVVTTPHPEEPETAAVPEAPSAPVPEPVPEPTPTPDPVLRRGMDAPEVAALQQRLIELGYLRASEPTSLYGPATEMAVRTFQEQCGLQADGEAGILTLEALYSEDAPVCIMPLSGVRIGLDPGHQAHGNSEQEPQAPGSSVTKPKVSSGTAGVVTGINEYQINLEIGLRLRDLLRELGAEVVMTRETNDVNISNSERALMMNEAEVDLVVRLHCDGEEDSSRNGAFILIPAGEYTTNIQETSRAAAQIVLEAYIETTGANSLGLSERDDQTGFNWSTVPVINIEMGHMSNPAEDQRLADSGYQDLMAAGIAEGLVRFFS